MPSRRHFISVVALGSAAAFDDSEADGGVLRRLRRRTASCPSQGDERVASASDKPDFVQPDYAKWQRIRVGMTRDQVVAILGPPLERDDDSPEWIEFWRNSPDEVRQTVSYHLRYGRLEFADPRVPTEFRFSIRIKMSTQEVSNISDPFEGRLSTAGEPTVPQLVVPYDKTVWEHFPRFLDLRWTPSSGTYPIRYEIETGFAQYELKDEKYVLTYHPDGVETSDIPYHAISFVGAQKGRWRVRAKNKHGVSAWTDYRYFEFKA